MDIKLDDVRIMKCKECGVEIPVNVNYPISEVTCLVCWAKKKTDKKWQKFVKPINAYTRPPFTLIPPSRPEKSVWTGLDASHTKGFGALRTCV